MIRLKMFKKIFRVILVGIFLLSLSGCSGSSNHIEIGDEVSFWTVEKNFDTDEYETVKVKGIVSQVAEYEDYYIVRLQGDIRTYQIDKENKKNSSE